ncbi:MAG: GNAT family N-acetyltransferase [Nitrospira sp.]
MVSEDIVIREARREDADILIRFSAAMAWETEQRELDRDRLRQGTLAVFDRADRGTFYVAEHRPDHAVIGQCLITYEWSDWRNAQFWWIQSVYVDTQWRRRGVYRRLHDSIRKRAQTTPGVCGIRLYVEQNNTTAQDAYRRAGLRRSGYLIFEEDFVYSSHSPKESP